jgi:hypothetical protein
MIGEKNHRYGKKPWNTGLAVRTNTGRTHFKPGVLSATRPFRKGHKTWNKGLRGYMGEERHWNWRGGISKENVTARRLFMKTIEYREWRKRVFERDNYQCVLCGKGGRLNADHIRPYSLFPDLRTNVSNGRTLCLPCHLNHGEKVNQHTISRYTVDRQ